MRTKQKAKKHTDTFSPKPYKKSEKGKEKPKGKRMKQKAKKHTDTFVPKPYKGKTQKAKAKKKKSNYEDDAEMEFATNEVRVGEVFDLDSDRVLIHTKYQFDF